MDKNNEREIYQELHELALKHDIDEMTIRLKSSEDEFQETYHYVNLDDQEYQFYLEGNTPTNFLTREGFAKIFLSEFVIMTYPKSREIQHMPWYNECIVVPRIWEYANILGPEAYLIPERRIKEYDDYLRLNKK